MGYWEGWKLSFDSSKSNKKLMKAIEFMQLCDDEDEFYEDYGDLFDSEEVQEPDQTDTFYQSDRMMDLDEQKLLIDILHSIAPDTWIKLAAEEGNNTSDSIVRYESVYSPETGMLYVGEVNYSYGDGTVFGEYVDDVDSVSHYRDFSGNYAAGALDADEIAYLCEDFYFDGDGLMELLDLPDNSSDEELDEIAKAQAQLHQQALEIVKKKNHKRELDNLIKNPLTSAKTLELLWRDSEEFDIIFHPNVSKRILKLAAESDGPDSINENLSEYPEAPVTLLRWLSGQDTYNWGDFHAAIAQHPNMTEELAIDLAQSSNSGSRLVAALCAKTPKAVLEQLANDEDEGVSSWARDNLDGTIDYDGFC